MEQGRGCGAVGRAVASDIRDLWFESQHWRSFSKAYICQSQFRRDENKEKEAGIGPLKKRRSSGWQNWLLTERSWVWFLLPAIFLMSTCQSEIFWWQDKSAETKEPTKLLCPGRWQARMVRCTNPLKSEVRLPLLLRRWPFKFAQKVIDPFELNSKQKPETS